MWYCIDCSSSSQPRHAMCIACKEFCHAGHQTFVANDNLPILGVCDCGNGIYSQCDKNDILNKNNPYFESKNSYMDFRFGEMTHNKKQCFCRKDYPYNEFLDHILK
jgi:hypothetical protein